MTWHGVAGRVHVTYAHVRNLRSRNCEVPSSFILDFFFKKKKKMEIEMKTTSSCEKNKIK